MHWDWVHAIQPNNNNNNNNNHHHHHHHIWRLLYLFTVRDDIPGPASAQSTVNWVGSEVKGRLSIAGP